MPHKTPRVCLGLALVACGCAHAGRARVTDARPESIIGAWRLVRYVTWDSAGTPQRPFGDSPSGYAVFDDTRHASIQLMQPGKPSSFAAYSGSYVLSGTAREFTISVEGGNLAEYLGTRQTRPFRIDADTLVLGIPQQYQATLVRIRNP